MQTGLSYAARARRHLGRTDPVLQPIMRRVGAYAPALRVNRFEVLVGAIISQQISTRAAESIEQRFLKLLGRKQPSAKNIRQLAPAQMRGVGLSRAKATYMHDLADRVASGLVDLDTIHEHDDEAVIEHLVQVKGIGRWTAEMFLMFCLGRPDVLPVDDFGLRAAVKLCDNLPELPTKAEVQQRGAIWAPYRSVATWYLWQNLRLSRGE